MALNYNLKNLRNKDFVIAPENAAVTDTIIMSTMAIGMGEITDKNLADFHARLSFLDKTCGPLVRHGNLKPYEITVEILSNYIGLKVNVTTITKAKFLTLQAGGLMRECEWKTRQEVEKLAMTKKMGLKVTA